MQDTTTISQDSLKNMMLNLEMHFCNNDLEKCNALADEYEQKREATGLPINNYLAAMKNHAPGLFHFITQTLEE